MTLGSRLGELRAHVNSHLAQTPFTIPDSWLSASHSCWCHCRRWITSPQVLCSSCRGAHSEIGHRRTPVADGLPLPPGPKPDIAIKLRDPGRLMPESKGLENSVRCACGSAYGDVPDRRAPSQENPWSRRFRVYENVGKSLLGSHFVSLHRELAGSFYVSQSYPACPFSERSPFLEQIRFSGQPGIGAYSEMVVRQGCAVGGSQRSCCRSRFVRAP